MVFIAIHDMCDTHYIVFYLVFWRWRQHKGNCGPKM